MMHTEDIIRIIREVSAGSLTEFSYKEGNVRLFLRKGDDPSGKEAAITSDTGLTGVRGATASDTGLTEERGATASDAGLTEERGAITADGGLTEARRAITAGASLPRDIRPSNEEFIQKSPLVGTFYRAPGEQDPPFVQVGDRVTKGQIVGIVEAMKLMNEIECEADGVVTEILAGNEEPVEYGQPLLRIKTGGEKAYE